MVPHLESHQAAPYQVGQSGLPRLGWTNLCDLEFLSLPLFVTWYQLVMLKVELAAASFSQAPTSPHSTRLVQQLADRVRSQCRLAGAAASEAFAAFVPLPSSRRRSYRAIQGAQGGSKTTNMKDQKIHVRTYIYYVYIYNVCMYVCR